MQKKEKRGAGIPDHVLARVASIYRAAEALGRPPTNAVKDKMPVARSTAGRYVMEARRRGFLGPALGTRPGERT